MDDIPLFFFKQRGKGMGLEKERFRKNFSIIIIPAEKRKRNAFFSHLMSLKRINNHLTHKQD